MVAFGFPNGGFVIPTVSTCNFIDTCGKLRRGRLEFVATLSAEGGTAPGRKLVDPC
jgi:hypothetical protein